MASRIKKSLVAPEQGYRHREHRSKKGRCKDLQRKKVIKKLRLRKNPDNDEAKGKWKI